MVPNAPAVKSEHFSFGIHHAMGEETEKICTRKITLLGWCRLLRN